MFFSRKKNPLEEQLEEYLQAADKCKEAFLGGLGYFIQNSKVDDGYMKFLQATKKYEGIADDLRDGIERRMYEESLIPESRGDVLAFLETFDRIPNRMEGIMEFIDEVNLSIPDSLDSRGREEFTRDFQELCNGIAQTFELTSSSAACFFSEPRRVRDYTVAIDRHESECDKVESHLKRSLFHHEGFSDLQKILFAELFKAIGDIADLAEDFQRRIILLSLKNLY